MQSVVWVSFSGFGESNIDRVGFGPFPLAGNLQREIALDAFLSREASREACKHLPHRAIDSCKVIVDRFGPKTNTGKSF
jgi:hypothetical protein